MSCYFTIFAVILSSIFLIIGYRSTKNIKNNDAYFLADRKLGVFAICMSLLATQLGGGVVLGTSELSYKYGIYGIFYTLGLSLGLIGITFFGARQLREKNIGTVAELFEKEYNSVFLRKVASAISIFSLYGILVSMIIGTRKLLVSFGIENEVILYAFWIVLIIYTVLGGMKAVVYTDVVQIIVIFLIFTVVVIYYLLKDFNYIQFAFENLLNTQNTNNVSFTPYILIPFLYVFIEQDMAQRFFSAKNTKVAYTSALLAGLLLLLFSFIPLVFGIAARKLGDVPDGGSAMTFFFIQTSNNFITSIAALAILCAIISTGDSLLCAISSNLMLDYFKKEDSLTYTRVFTVILGITAIIIANYFNDIVKVMLVGYEIMVCTLFLPIVACYFNFRKKAVFAYSSILLGLIGFLLHAKITAFFNCNITRELFCILLSLLAFPFSEIFERFYKPFQKEKMLK